MSYLDREVIRIKFKSDPNLWADLYAETTWDDGKAFRDAKENDEGLFRMIKEWNVPGPDDTILPLTYENLGKLRSPDMDVLFKAFWDILGKNAEKMPSEEKKKDKSSSSKPLTDSPAGKSPTAPTA